MGANLREQARLFKLFLAGMDLRESRQGAKKKQKSNNF
jgi:hypothetical protein